MSWSTSQVAHLADVTVRAIRHWHAVGLLPEPERSSNGYRRYQTADLLRVFYIRRLSSLGFSLAQIAEFDTPHANKLDAFERLNAEISARICELQQAQRDLPAALSNELHHGLPPGFSPPDDGTHLTGQEKAVVGVLGHLLPKDRQERLALWIEQSGSTPVDEEFNSLPAETPEHKRLQLAHRMLPEARRVQALSSESGTNPKQVKVKTQRAIGAALNEIYNPAQLDVLVKVSELLQVDPLPSVNSERR